MSDPTTPPESPDAIPTQALQLGDQQPIVPPPAPHARGGHTRTILEVVGGVVAVGLIFMAGALGFFVGHATGSNDDQPWRMMDSNADGRMHDGPNAEGPFGGLPGRGAERGDDGYRSGDTEEFYMGPGQGQGPGRGQGPGQGFGQGQGEGTGPGSMMDDEGSMMDDESAESSQG